MILATAGWIRGGYVVTFLCALSLASCAPVPAQGQSPGARTKSVLLDCYFNNEWKTDTAGIRVRYHYVWSDTANSGFSILEGVIARCGGLTDTLCRAPSKKALRGAAIYLIVDPDTPLESKEPHYIEPVDAAVIADWVRGGGVLVLMGNDRGNAEFVHLNALASVFGITFNEDSRNRVVGREYATGAFERFPVHPLFEGVRRIFIKELSTLTVREPANPVLSDGGDVIMASARYGKGTVFAVGDPWFYNEYMDQRRLPEGYDNAKAAANLFTWLLRLAGGGS